MKRKKWRQWETSSPPLREPTAPPVKIEEIKDERKCSLPPSTTRQCRICLMEGSVPTNDYLVEMINNFTNINMRQDDLLPKFLCESCHDLLIAAVLLRDMARESDSKLKCLPFNKKSNFSLRNTKNWARNLVRKLAKNQVLLSSVNNNEKELNSNDVDDNVSAVLFDEPSDFDIMSCLRCEAEFVDTVSYNEHLAMHQAESYNEVKNKHPSSFDEEKEKKHITNINNILLTKLEDESKETIKTVDVACEPAQSLSTPIDTQQKRIVENLNKRLKLINSITGPIIASKTTINMNTRFTCVANVSRKNNNSKSGKPQVKVYTDKCFLVCNEIQAFHVHAHKHLVNRGPVNETLDLTRANSPETDVSFTAVYGHNISTNKTIIKVRDFAKHNVDKNARDYYDNDGPNNKPSSFNRKTYNDSEGRGHDSESFKCKECNNDCIGFSSYIAHLQTHLRVKYPPKMRQWVCETCQSNFKHKEYMYFIMHMARHIACRVCNNEKKIEELTSVRQLCPQHKKMLYRRKRRQYEVKNVLCETCGKYFGRSDYKKHILTHAKDMRVECKLCPYRTTRIGLLNQHIAYRHSERRRFVCDQCEKSFASSSNLGSHKKFAHSSKRYVCNVDRCKRKCVTESALKYHVQNEHMGGKGWECDYCEQRFHKRSGYWRHMFKVHKTSTTKGRLPKYLRKTDK